MRQPARQIWKTFTIPEVPKVVGKNSRGKDMLEPAGAGIWATPTLDVKRRALYVRNRERLLRDTRDANAIMAMNIDTGKVLWSMQALPFDTWHNGVFRTFPGVRQAPAARGGARAGGAGRPGGPAEVPAFRIRPRTVRRCSGPTGISAAPPAFATTGDGRDVLIAPQKQGLVWALNPENGEVLWKQDVAREIAGGRGETLFGGAVDSEKAYFGLISSAHLALDLRPGKRCGTRRLVPPRGARTSAASSARSR